jgi:hypothetical protein
VPTVPVETGVSHRDVFDNGYVCRGTLIVGVDTKAIRRAVFRRTVLNQQVLDLPDHSESVPASVLGRADVRLVRSIPIYVDVIERDVALGCGVA